MCQRKNDYGVSLPVTGGPVGNDNERGGVRAHTVILQLLKISEAKA